MCITWPILLPINATGGNGKTQLELISYSNINIETSSRRLYAHVLTSWVVYGFVMYMITRECIFYINLRQAYLLSPRFASRISARTVLFTCVPSEYLNEDRIRGIFGSTVRHVWLAGQSKKVDEIVRKRDRAAEKLEEAEMSYLKRANRLYGKRARQAEKRGAPLDPREGVPPHLLEEVRPRRREGFLGLRGAEVDTVTQLRNNLQTLVREAEAAQADWRAGSFEKLPAVFVEFETNTQAQTAFQLITHHHGFRMAPKYIGVRPEEVIWPSLGMSWWRKTIFQYIMYAFVGALIVFWAIPVGFVGIIAQVSVIQSLPGLTWISEIPEVCRLESRSPWI